MPKTLTESPSQYGITFRIDATTDPPTLLGVTVHIVATDGRVEHGQVANPGTIGTAAERTGTRGYIKAAVTAARAALGWT